MSNSVLPPNTPIGIDGRYIIKSHIASGGFGNTYLAEDTMLGIDVALKEYFPRNIVQRQNNGVVSADGYDNVFSSGIKSFGEEAKLMASLAGTPGVVNIKDTFRFNGTVYIVMEYVKGTSLAQYLKEHGNQLSWQKTAAFLAPIAGVLLKLHEKGIVHRDITPANIMIDEGGKSKLLDFGSAVMSEITLKPGYAPYEMYDGEITVSVDTYSLAATVYKCLTGITPPAADERAIRDTIAKPSALGSDIPAAAEDILLKALAIKPEDRLSDEDLFKLLSNISASTASPAPAKTMGLGLTKAVNKKPVPKQEKQTQVKSETILPSEAPEEITVRLDYSAYQASEDEEITIFRDCSALYQRKTAQDEALEKAGEAAKAAQESAQKAAKATGEAINKAVGKAGNFIKNNPALMKKIGIGTAVVVIAAGAGTYGYNEIYLNSAGQIYKRAVEALDNEHYNNAVHLAEASYNKGYEKAEYIMCKAIFSSYSVDYYPAGWDQKTLIEKSLAYADNGDLDMKYLICDKWRSQTNRGTDSYPVLVQMVSLGKVTEMLEDLIENNYQAEYLSNLYVTIGNLLVDQGEKDLNIDMIKRGVNLWKNKELLAGTSPASAERYYNEWVERYSKDINRRIARNAERKAREEAAAQRRKEREERRALEQQERERRQAERQARREQERAKRQAASTQKASSRSKQIVKKATKRTTKPAQQVQNLSRYGAAVVFGDILQLIVQFPVNVQTEVLVFFHVILTSTFE